MSNCSNGILVGLVLIVALGGCVSTPEKPTVSDSTKPTVTTAPKRVAKPSPPANSVPVDRAPAAIMPKPLAPVAEKTVPEPKMESVAPADTRESAVAKRVETSPKDSRNSAIKPTPVEAKPSKSIPKSRADRPPVEPSVSRTQVSVPDKPATPVAKEAVKVSKPGVPARVVTDAKPSESTQKSKAKPLPESSNRDATELEISQAVAAADSVESTDSGESRIAMLSKPEPVTPDIPDLSKLSYDLEHLPMSFPGGWKLDKRPNPIDGKVWCLLYSPKLAMFDGYDKSRVQLQVTTEAVVVKAESNLDASYPNQGLRVDSGALAAFESELLNEKVAYTKKPVQAAMASGRRLTVTLGFWPTWPVTKTQEATVDLNDFPHAYRALQACTKE